MRIGQGFDAHRFQAGRRLVLGGVDIPYERGMEAHSDGDVVVHAVCDALLGAVALGDIGRHFPDTDQTIKGIDSRVMLRHIVSLVQRRGLRVGNVDATIIAQAPKVAPHIPAMCENLANDMRIDIDCVNVKATTTEKMGFAGRGEGIAALAVALVVAA
ncbi:MAG: 2-C-methyl-D-erythritol 2,4-cyclodiphosphate synthase [Gammaproteobacteria bacterium]|nr:2-C-methyl-D-erythritol 2,4-cyclodiphosphate synthase [Gammaproteobacteria bacterium]